MQTCLEWLCSMSLASKLIEHCGPTFVTSEDEFQNPPAVKTSSHDAGHRKRIEIEDIHARSDNFETHKQFPKDPKNVCAHNTLSNAKNTKQN